MRLTEQDIADISLARRLLGSGEAEQMREADHLTKTEVAEVIGCTSDAIALWEAGRRTPRTDAALKLGRLYRRLLVAGAPQ